MKIKRIDLDDQNKPERTLAELDRDEFVFLAVLMSCMSSRMMNGVQPNGAQTGMEINRALNRDLILPFWAAGLGAFEPSQPVEQHPHVFTAPDRCVICKLPRYPYHREVEQ